MRPEGRRHVDEQVGGTEGRRGHGAHDQGPSDPAWPLARGRPLERRQQEERRQQQDSAVLRGEGEPQGQAEPSGSPDRGSLAEAKGRGHRQQGGQGIGGVDRRDAAVRHEVGFEGRGHGGDVSGLGAELPLGEDEDRHQEGRQPQD